MAKKSNKVDELGDELANKLRHENALMACSARARNSHHPDNDLYSFFDAQALRAYKKAKKLESLIKGRR